MLQNIDGYETRQVVSMKSRILPDLRRLPCVTGRRGSVGCVETVGTDVCVNNVST